MDIEDQKRIFKCYSELVDCITGEDVTDYLISETVLTIEDGEVIRSKETDSSKARMMIDILLKKKSFNPGVNAYGVFIKALNKSNRDDLVIILQNADISEISDLDLEPTLTTDEKIDLVLRLLKEQFNNPLILQNALTTSSNNQIIPCSNGYILAKNLNICTRMFNTVGNDGQLTNPGDMIDSTRILTFSREQFYYKNSTEAMACEIGLEILLNKNLNHPPHFNLLIRKMNMLIVEITNSDRERLLDCISKLHIVELQSGFLFVSKIAAELFIDKNWGRILAWFAFWRSLATSLPYGDTSGDGNDMNTRMGLGNLIGLVLCEECGKWIDRHGGWSALLEYHKKSYCSVQ